LRALSSPDPGVRKDAEEALKSTRPALLYFDVYANPFYTARFSDRVGYAEAQLGWKPVKSWPVSLYLGARWTQDSRSHSGTLPEIYSDNVAMAGGGIRIQPKGWSASLSAEYNAAYNLTRGGDHPDTLEADRRVTLSDYHWWD